MKRFAKQTDIPLDVPWVELEAAQQRTHSRLATESFWACAASSQYLERKKYKLHIRVFLSRYRGYSTLP